MTPFTCLLVATGLAISVGYIGTKIADVFRKDTEELDQKSTQ